MRGGYHSALIGGHMSKLTLAWSRIERNAAPRAALSRGRTDGKGRIVGRGATMCFVTKGNTVMALDELDNRRPARRIPRSAGTIRLWKVEVASPDRRHPETDARNDHNR